MISLHFAALAAEPRSYATFGRGRGPIFLDDVHCNGTELWLANCTNRGIGVHDCVHYQDAGVVCKGKVIKEPDIYYIYGSFVTIITCMVNIRGLGLQERQCL